MPPNQLIKCACGCGEDRWLYNEGDDRPRQYIKGHYWRGKTIPRREANTQIFCACGCGTLFWKWATWGKRKFVVASHARRGHRKGQAAYKCKFCGKEGTTYQSFNRECCSLVCAAKWRCDKRNLTEESRTKKRYAGWERNRPRDCHEVKTWRHAVFARDNYTCQDCSKIGGALNAHHIKRWAKFPDLRFDVSNGRTLCTKCHRQYNHLQDIPTKKKPAA